MANFQLLFPVICYLLRPAVCYNTLYHNKRKEMEQIFSSSNALIILGFLALILPAWEFIFKDKKITKQGVALIIVGLLMIVFSFMKGKRDDKKEENFISKIDTLTSKLTDSRKRVDSILKLLKENRESQKQF